MGLKRQMTRDFKRRWIIEGNNKVIHTPQGCTHLWVFDAKDHKRRCAYCGVERGFGER